MSFPACYDSAGHWKSLQTLFSRRSTPHPIDQGVLEQSYYPLAGDRNERFKRSWYLPSRHLARCGLAGEPFWASCWAS